MGVKGFVEGGGIASIIAGCSTHPLDLIKVRMLLQGESPPVYALNGGGGGGTTMAIPQPPAGPISVGVKIFRTEGVAALFSGVSATVLRQTLNSTTRMGLYEIFKQKWSDPETGNLSLPRKIGSELLAGGIDAAVGNPADVAMEMVFDFQRILLRFPYGLLISPWLSFLHTFHSPGLISPSFDSSIVPHLC